MVDSDDSAEESVEDVPGNTSEIDDDDAAGPEISFHTEPAVDRMGHSPTSATEKSVPKGKSYSSVSME